MKFQQICVHYDSCYRCHHSKTFIEEVNRGNWWKPVDWPLFTEYDEFPDEDDFKEKFPKYIYEFMEMMCDMMGDKEFKTKDDVNEMIEDIALELNTMCH